MERTTSPTHSTEVTWDARGLPVAERIVPSSLLGWPTNQFVTHTLTWGRQGELRTRKTSTGTTGSGITVGEFEWVRDNAGRATGLKNGTTVIAQGATYDEAGALEGAVLGIGTWAVTASWLRNPATRELDGIDYFRTGRNLVNIEIGSYDKNGNPLEESRWSTLSTGVVRSWHKKHRYDGFSRLDRTQSSLDGGSDQIQEMVWADDSRLLSGGAETCSYGDDRFAGRPRRWRAAASPWMPPAASSATARGR